MVMVNNAEVVNVNDEMLYLKLISPEIREAINAVLSPLIRSKLVSRKLTDELNKNLAELVHIVGSQTFKAGYDAGRNQNH